MPGTPPPDPLLTIDPEYPFRILFLDLNSYFASVEQQEDPQLRGVPVGVTASEGENTCLIAASIEAKPFGLRTGTPLREARRLCPGLVLRPARHALYVAYHHRVLAEVERHVAIERVHSIDELSVRLLGPQRRLPEALALAGAIKAGIVARVGPCLRCSIGLAPSRLLAKLATDMHKPDGLVALGPADLPGRLVDLPLREFSGIGARMAARLEACGVRDVMALWEMGPKRARAIWGSVQGERFWYGLRGADLPEPALPSAPRSISHARVLPPRLRDAEAARHVARLLALKATARLREARCQATRLGLGIKMVRGQEEQAASLHGEARLRQTEDERVVLAALDQIWGRLAVSGPRLPRFLRVSVVLAGLVEAADTTPDLLDWASPDKGGVGLSQAIAAVHRRFGRDSLIFGDAPRDREAYAGNKIAFSRVPS